MAAHSKAVLATCATAAFAVIVTACGGSTSSTTSSVSSASSAMSSAMSSAVSSATSAATSAAAAAEGTLASVCTEIDGIMLGQPDADPAGTAKQLEAIKAKVTTGDADLIEAVASAYAALAANPGDTEAQTKLSSSSKALGAGCETATAAPGHN